MRSAVRRLTSKQVTGGANRHGSSCSIGPFIERGRCMAIGVRGFECRSRVWRISPNIVRYRPICTNWSMSPRSDMNVAGHCPNRRYRISGRHGCAMFCVDQESNTFGQFLDLPIGKKRTIPNKNRTYQLTPRPTLPENELSAYYYL